ncbi:MAG: sensor histidine kinase, partial [Clostridiales bacterium]|nr:sensor histidine kinase [Clostridiales bacterium]
MIKKLNEVFDKVLSSINESKTEIFEITEEIHNEYKDLEMQIEIIKERVKNIIEEVDKLEILEKNSRKKLLKVSRDFTIYSELDIHKAYEEANILQIQLNVKREEERKLLQQRSDMEIRLKRLGDTLEKAENLTNRISIVEEFLGDSIKYIHSTVEDIQQTHIFGRKIITAQEEERKRIAREIHDGPAQSLSGLVIKAEICSKLLDIDRDKVRVELCELKKRTRESIKDIRKIIYNLRPTAIDDLGL